MGVALKELPVVLRWQELRRRAFLGALWCHGGHFESRRQRENLTTGTVLPAPLHFFSVVVWCLLPPLTHKRSECGWVSTGTRKHVTRGVPVVSFLRLLVTYSTTLLNPHFPFVLHAHSATEFDWETENLGANAKIWNENPIKHDTKPLWKQVGNTLYMGTQLQYTTMDTASPDMYKIAQKINQCQSKRLQLLTKRIHSKTEIWIYSQKSFMLGWGGNPVLVKAECDNVSWKLIECHSSCTEEMFNSLTAPDWRISATSCSCEY